MTQGVAEFLAITTMLQVAVPDTKVIFCFGSGILDMRQTTFSIGCLENSMMSVAATEVGHYLGVPTMNPAQSTDARYPGIQAGYEKALKALTVCSANPDLVSGWGLIDSSNMLYLPQLVIDNEIARMVRRHARATSRSRETTHHAGGVRARGDRRRLPAREGDGAARARRRALPAADQPTASPTRSGSRWGGPRTTRRAP